MDTADPVNDPTDGDTDTDRNLSRRGFLAASSFLVLGQGQGSGFTRPPQQRASKELREILLRPDDLIAPTEDTYTGLRVELDDASLVQFIRENVTGFEEEEGVVAGFMARRKQDSVPLYVESAVVEVDDAGSTQAISAATADWVQTTHASNDDVKLVDAKRGKDLAQWNVLTHDDWLDVIRVRRVGGTRVLFTVTYGDLSARVAPLAAVEHYARIMHDRATEGRAGVSINAENR